MPRVPAIGEVARPASSPAAPPPQQATGSRARAIRQRRAQAKSMLIPRATPSTSIWGVPGTSLVAAHHDRAQKGGHLFFACLWRTFHMDSLRTGVALDISADALARHTRPLVSSLYRTAFDCRNLSANQPLFLRNGTAPMVMHKALYGTAAMRRVGVWRGGFRLSMSVCRPFRLAVP